MSRGGAPTSPPPQVRVIYADLDATPAGPSGSSLVEWSAWYDLAQDEIAAGSVAGQLARLGLAYDAGEFTALVPVVLSVDTHFTVVAAPGGACSLDLLYDGYMANMDLAIPNPNTLGSQFLRMTMALAAGDTFSVSRTCTNASDTPTSYAELTIIRLV